MQLLILTPSVNPLFNNKLPVVITAGTKIYKRYTDKWRRNVNGN